MGYKFKQPNFTSQQPSEVKTNIENSIGAMQRIGEMFNVYEQDTPDMTVGAAAGHILKGNSLTEVAATAATGTITAPTTNPRIDRVTLNLDDSTIVVTSGAENASPVAPAIPNGHIPLAQIALTTSTTTITSTEITDERSFVVQAGKQTVIIPANGMSALTTSGAALLQAELTAGNPERIMMQYDGRRAQHAQFMIAFPKGWDLGAVTYQIFWTTDNATAGDVVWVMRAVALANGDAIDTAYSTPVRVTDTAIASSDVHVAAESGALTIAGAPAADELVYFKVSRAPGYPQTPKRTPPEY